MRVTPSMREVLDALEWVRAQMMHKGSPDFVRQRQAEAKVQALCAKLVRGGRELHHPRHKRQERFKFQVNGVSGRNAL